MDEQAFYADNVRHLERAYLRARTAEEGFGGDDRQWRQARHHITEGISSSGTFLDVGCANGLLMESVAGWCAERGLIVEPYGIDLGPAAGRARPAAAAALGRPDLGRQRDRLDAARRAGSGSITCMSCLTAYRGSCVPR
jgi:hypothetical protein